MHGVISFGSLRRFFSPVLPAKCVLSMSEDLNGEVKYLVGKEQYLWQLHLSHFYILSSFYFLHYLLSCVCIQWHTSASDLSLLFLAWLDRNREAFISFLIQFKCCKISQAIVLATKGHNLKFRGAWFLTLITVVVWGG